jgi:hypothetical protein
MKISNHALLRMQQRKIWPEVVTFMEQFLPPAYRNSSNQIILDRKTATTLAKKLRKTAERIEKSKGTKIILDSAGTTIITTYKKY